MRVYLVIDKQDCLVESVLRNDDGSLKSAYVINGGWDLEIRDGELLAKNGDKIVTRRTFQTISEYPVPDSVDDDYNEAMTFMEKSLASTCEIEAHGRRKEF